jgi:hypothetical protein
MAKEKADSDKPGWFARWRERRAWNKQREGNIGRRAHDARSEERARAAKHGGIPPGPVAGG